MLEGQPSSTVLLVERLSFFLTQNYHSPTHRGNRASHCMNYDTRPFVFFFSAHDKGPNSYPFKLFLFLCFIDPWTMIPRRIKLMDNVGGKLGVWEL